MTMFEYAKPGFTSQYSRAWGWASRGERDGSAYGTTASGGMMLSPGRRCHAPPPAACLPPEPGASPAKEISRARRPGDGGRDGVQRFRPAVSRLRDQDKGDSV